MSPSLHSTVVPIAEVPQNDATESGPIILIVDDERVIADTLSIILTRNGFRTFTAYDGSSAAELADEVQPHLLISDVVMPGMTGVELAILLTELVPDCKILLFSGQAATSDLLSGARAMGYNFAALTKPVHPRELLRHISGFLDVEPAWNSPEHAVAYHPAGAFSA